MPELKPVCRVPVFPIAACAPGFRGNRLVRPVEWMYSGHLITIRPQLSHRPRPLFHQALQMHPHHHLLMVSLKTCEAIMEKDLAFQRDGSLRVLQFPPRVHLAVDAPLGIWVIKTDLRCE